MLVAVLVMAILFSGVSSALAQSQECKFLNESCSNEELPRTRTDTKRSFSDHLQRCLADYVRRKGPFVPEGQSSKVVKSRSDMTAMCKFAIERSNFYWDSSRNSDEVANLKCCLGMGISEKDCRSNIRAARQSIVDVDFCQMASKAGEPPPPEWNVPKDCKGGPCMVTPGYCQSVGYSRMDAASARDMVTSLRESMAKFPASRDQFKAILRVCFGVS